jgi:hypothetical protein
LSFQGILETSKVDSLRKSDDGGLAAVPDFENGVECLTLWSSWKQPHSEEPLFKVLQTLK